ncbi:MAG TPA: hypothetical protein DEG69_05730 [Flavobacteriaceae bacterium]|nr:hypothetical protein [Flavobacteriaceae bacterium]|tara:strand:+ start:216 stop:455 length:240 start_codon:yes stop_codon:yes gene_type:complete
MDLNDFIEWEERKAKVKREEIRKEKLESLKELESLWNNQMSSPISSNMIKQYLMQDRSTLTYWYYTMSTTNEGTSNEFE